MGAVAVRIAFGALAASACASASASPPGATTLAHSQAAAQTSIATPTPTSPPTSPPPPAPLADEATWRAWERADELILRPHRFADAVEPLARHRESQRRVVARLDIEPLFARASRDARALAGAIRTLAAHAPATLRYVLLVGDSDELPTFYLRKVGYEHHTAKEHDNPHAITFEEHASYPSDELYAVVADDPAAARLAVGRVPARSPDDVSAFVRKVIAYETAPPSSADASWRRRVLVYAGNPYFGELADGVVENVASGILDRDMTYDFDLRLTFAKDDSPYAYPFDRIERKLVSDLDDGALVAAYVGHGAVTRFAPAEFRGRAYEVGTSDDAAALRIGAGKPIFFSIACDTGAFDRPEGLPSIAERMILNPDGPVAVFASSRESHPYPNALYGQAVIRHFVNERPATVGDGIVAVKESMRRGSIAVAEMLLGDDVEALKKEHVGLYNLFGDPATRLSYPAPLAVTLASAGVAAGAGFAVDVATRGVTEGRVRVTVETRRGALRPGIAAPGAVARMTEADAFGALAHNNALANDKVVFAAETEMHAGKAHVALRAPDREGDYVVKALASGDGAAAGHAELQVGAPKK